MRLTNILILIVFLCSCCSKTVNDAKKNYLEKEVEINLVRTYLDDISRNDLNIDLRFEEAKKVSITVRQKDYWNKESWIKNKIFDKYGMYQVYEEPFNSPKVGEFLKLMNWEVAQLDSLSRMLENANCFTIGKHFKMEDFEKKYISIGYPTNDLYGLTYQLLDTALTKKEQKIFLDKCSFDLINDKVLIEYGGPAWGSNCIPKRK